MESVLFGAVKLVTLALVGYWMYTDAKGRDDHPVIWTASAILLGFFGIGVLGPILLAAAIGVYLLKRPKGLLRACPHCKKPVLASLANCPHCKGVLKKDCYRCFHVVDVTMERCPNCNAKL